MVACPTGAELCRFLTHDESLGRRQVEQIEAHVKTCESCQAALDRLADKSQLDKTMTLLPGYRFEERLGSGAFGEVLAAQELNLPRTVAIKTLNVSARVVSPRQSAGRAPPGRLRDDAGCASQRRARVCLARPFTVSISWSCNTSRADCLPTS